MVMPFVWMLSTSLKQPGTEFVFPPQWIPEKFDWSNYPGALDRVPLFTQMLNSLKVASLITIGQVATSATAAYAFARMRFPGREWLFVVYLATMMVPEHVKLIPQFVVMNYLDMLDTHSSLIVPKLVSAFGVFLLRQFFMTIPRELEEAAIIDGCNPLRVFWNIMLPLSKPALTALAIFVFMGSWNDLLHPLIFISSNEMRTLPVGLAFFSDFNQVDYTLLMAAATMALGPVIVVYLFAQRYFIEGIALSGIKG
ncbi:carbohydrate ABC transporter permease [Paenibacillus piri]|uniref:Carbohydrate ABC transporter permease n=2 Tax=Paenibacillus piri TaxID=2547395 RepID=A0A4R5KV18_9BACL|nr:carbohydrate ABC transporter permease [Paenibacillus piri]